MGVVNGPVHERQRRTLGDSGVLQTDQQSARQRARDVCAAVRVPMWQSADHAALPVGQRRPLTDPSRRQQAGSLRCRQQADNRPIPQRPDREPQAEQRGSTADQHLPACHVGAEFAAGIGVELDCVGRDPEQPRLRI